MSDSTVYEAKLDLSFCARYHQICEGFYLRVNDITLFVNLLFSSAAIGAVLKQADVWAIAAGVLVTLLTALNIVMGSARKAQTHRDLYRRYTDLEARSAGMDEPALRAEIARVERDEPPVIDAFRKRAYIDNLKRHGHEDRIDHQALKLGPLEKLRNALS